jgi:hypothetical protein
MSATTHYNLDLDVFSRHRAPRLVSVVARITGFELDCKLARGEDPRVNPLLAARAEYVCRYDQRRLIAERLYEIACGEPRHGAGSGLFPSRRAVAASRTDLVVLVGLLERPGPADPEGVARARLLLIDGSGPLYPPERIRRLASLTRQACERLGGSEFA